MVIYGYGDQGSLVADCLLEAGIPLKGIFDDNRALNRKLCPFPFLGKYSPDSLPHEAILLTIGDNQVRKQLARIIRHPPGILQHASVIRSARSEVGEGSVLLHRAVLQAGSRIGRHCIVNTGVIVEHDCQLGNFVHLASGVILSGRVFVGEGSLLGAGAVVLPGIKVGENCVVGAGAVVTKNVKDGGTVVGNPARLL